MSHHIFNLVNVLLTHLIVVYSELTNEIIYLIKKCKHYLVLQYLQ